jgi:hypothetical protein
MASVFLIGYHLPEPFQIERCVIRSDETHRWFDQFAKRAGGGNRTVGMGF